jgi:hypothetical protein
MDHRPAEQWEHKTAAGWRLQEPVGIDLFDEENGAFTAIYLRFADGTRWPARTVNMANPQRAAEILAAWSKRGPVNDYRVATTVTS